MYRAMPKSAQCGSSRWPVFVVALTMLGGGLALGGNANPFEGQADLTPDTPIDRLVLVDLNRLGIQPAKVCSDGVFVRRV
jgi:hypothetical protein